MHFYSGAPMHFLSGVDSPDTIEVLRTLLGGLTAHRDAVLAAATDADAAGERIAASLLDLATAAGVRCERLLPPDARKDWNDVAVACRHTASD